jgi:nucleotide-binding universal stress UspA family protein
VAEAEPLARREIAKDGPTAIVVGYDASDPARGAMAMALGLARRNQAYLWVCFVGAMPTMTGAAAAAAGPAAVSLASEYEEIRQAVHGYLAELGVPGTCIRRDGDPARELEKLAEEVQADLIVVGRSSGRTHAVVGSVAVALVKKAHRPVVVVP